MKKLILILLCLLISGCAIGIMSEKDHEDFEREKKRQEERRNEPQIPPIPKIPNK